ncbi:MAG: hypothetical protein K2N15_02845 [Lachnospiraceae bacterium]|nr:hypothetical protein [Lachnospiraceae bacterium]
MKEAYNKTDYREIEIPISEKYMLTIKEASAYFNIGIKKMRRLAEDNTDSFAILMGNRYLIIRMRFEDYINSLLAGKEEMEQ